MIFKASWPETSTLTSTSMAMMAGLKPTIACMEAFAHTDFRPDLAAFAVPTLIVHGTKDQTVPIDTSARPAAAGPVGSPAARAGPARAAAAPLTAPRISSIGKTRRSDGGPALHRTPA